MSEATSGNIEKVVEEDQLDALTKLILVNAIYFKGELFITFQVQYHITHQFNNHDYHNHNHITLILTITVIIITTIIIS